MIDVLPVSDADVLSAWNDYYDRGPQWGHVPIPPPRADDVFDRIVLMALRRVLENYRKRVIERSAP